MTEEPPGCETRIVSANEVIMNTIAAPVVALSRRLPVLRAPNVV